MFFSHSSNHTIPIDPAAERPKNTSLIIICGALVFSIAFLLHYHYLLNMFYHSGASYNDAGILAQIIWRGDWKLTPSLTFTNYSFYGVHCSPIFTVLNALSYLLNTHLPEFYSAFIASIYAGLGTALFSIIILFGKPRNPMHIVGFALLSLAFAFHTIIMNGIWIGHFEYAIPLGIMLFLIFYVQERTWPCLLSFALLLSIREDAGFHLVAILGLVGILRFVETRTLHAVSREAKFIIAAICYSIIAMWISLAARSYFGSTFQQIYSGTPPFSHISLSMLLERLGRIGDEHIYLWTGFIITAFVAWRDRNPYMMVGFVAYIPWFIINWIAINPNTGVLYAYYAFPFLLSTAWPLFGVIFRYGFPLPLMAARKALKLQIILVLLGLLMWNGGKHNLEFGPDYGARWGRFGVQQGMENRHEVRSFIAKFEGGAGNLGIVIADNGILSLIKSGQYRGERLLRIDTDKPAQTVIYMRSTYAVWQQRNVEVLQKALEYKLTHHYCMPDTSICMFTKKSAADLGLLLTFFTQTSMPAKPESH